MGNLSGGIKEAFEIFLKDKEDAIKVIIIDDNEFYIKGENKVRYLNQKDSKNYDRYDKFVWHVIRCKEPSSAIYFEANKNKVFLIDNFKNNIEDKEEYFKFIDDDTKKLIDLLKELNSKSVGSKILEINCEKLGAYLFNKKILDVFKILQYIEMNVGYSIFIYVSNYYLDVLENSTTIKEHNNYKYIRKYIDDGKDINKLKLKSFTVKKGRIINVKSYDETFKGIDNANKENYCKVFDIDYKYTNPTTENKDILNKISNIKANTSRKLKKINNKIDLGELKEEFPNYTSFFEYIEDEVTISSKIQNKIQVSPALLVGPPGIGKTFLLNKIAKILELPSYFLNAGTLTGGFIINGLSSGWGTGQPGFVFKSLYESDVANPLCFLDEIDKFGHSDVSPVEPVLLSILENHTAKEFIDEFWNFKMNASNINWIATANDVKKISEPLLSRFSVFEIPLPNYEERKIFTKSIINEIVENKGLTPLYKGVSDEFIAEIAKEEGSLRDIGKVIKESLSASIRRDDENIFLTPDDIKIKNKTKRGIGF